jgi:hypothetical protein
MKTVLKASTLPGRFRWLQNERFIQTVQMPTPLGKGNHDIRFPKMARDLRQASS